MVELLLMRHGQTDWNIKNIMQGVTDTPLNDSGKKQVKDSIKSLPNNIEGIITSPLKRAQSTAAIINNCKGLDIHIDNRLKERDYGSLTGKDVKLVYSLLPITTKGVEKEHHIEKRVVQFLGDMKNRNGRFLVITHGAIILNLLSIISGNEFSWLENPIGNCTVTTIRYNSKWETV